MCHDTTALDRDFFSLPSSCLLIDVLGGFLVVVGLVVPATYQPVHYECPLGLPIFFLYCHGSGSECGFTDIIT